MTPTTAAITSLTVTPIYAGGFALLAVLLANQVLYVRLRPKTELSWRINAVERVQANFIENVPLALVLLLIIELMGATNTVLHLLGGSLLLCRLLHAWGMSRNEGANYPRLIGAQGTFLLLSVMGAATLWQGLALS